MWVIGSAVTFKGEDDWLCRFTCDLDRSARILAVDTEIDEGSEAHAEHVRRHLDSFDDGCAATVQEDDFKRR